ncbi:alpha/beta fold hydrolase [Shimia abyssi]|uniref:Pimeloyl-ACP methyl ester carboxylesterase n=1 Tax=Shimia abyssi TaxID=1662395 RepID=A0A2P8F905_9RHOB|nr:alpha/beta fold hydrolase [Shimia abyssi]PSL18216.1 pimeloyl-ACP methyl ester carboxylesterase [Shimia abyssi]
MQITANGIKLDIETFGPADGIPLILIRGLGSQLIHWPSELTHGLAARGYRVVIFDNRDVGQSERCPDPDVPTKAEALLDIAQSAATVPTAYALADMARDVTGLMDALDIKTAHIFGISMGGMITQLLAIHHAKRLRSASMVMTSARPENDPRTVRELLAYPTDQADYVEGWVQEHAQNGSPGYPMTEAEIRDQAEIAWSRGVDAEGINRQLLAIMAASDRRPDLPSITVPCQVIHGTDDALIPLDLGAEIAGLIPGCHYHAIDGMGHIITPALAPLIVGLIDDFISGLSNQAPP